MKNKRKLLFRLGALVVLAALALGMYVSGRGHTLYLDNKTLEYEGVSYEAPYRAVVYQGDTEVAKLQKRDRGMMTWIGQSVKLKVEMIEQKGADPVPYEFTVDLPFHQDGIVLNLPAMVAGLPASAYMSEFVPMATTSEPAEDELPTDEFDMTEFQGG